MKQKYLSDEVNSAFIADSLIKNHNATNVIVGLIIIIESFNIYRVLYLSKSGLSVLNNQIYFSLYVIILLSAFIIKLLEYLYKDKPHALMNLYTCYAIFLMTWHVVLNAYDLHTSGSDTIVFMTAMFGIAVFSQLKPHLSILINIAAYFLFICLSINYLNVGIILNTTISVAVSIFIALTRYQHTITEIEQTLKIEKINASLKEKHDELFNANKLRKLTNLKN